MPSYANARWVGRSSQTPGLQKNADGSVDIYLRSDGSGGQGESNWVPTDPNGRFEVLARFYGPEKPLFDKTWKLPDIETDHGAVKLDAVSLTKMSLKGEAS